MSTRESIILLAEKLVKEKGFNAFSFHDIAATIGIKTASIHYHFPTKADLGVAVLEQQKTRLYQMQESVQDKGVLAKLEAFFSIYNNLPRENMVCMVGSLATDFNAIDPKVQENLSEFADLVLQWLTDILQEGKRENIFHFTTPAKVKAVQIASSMVGVVQLQRLVNEDDNFFKKVKDNIIKELKAK